MSVTTQSRTTTTRKRSAQSLVTPTAPVGRQQTAEPTAPIQPNQTTSTNLVFQVLLGAAAILALVAVVQQAGNGQINPTSVDAPPPAVFVQAD